MIVHCLLVRIGFPHETTDVERRVPITPDIAKRYISADHVVVVARDAGVAAGHLDADYEAAGCQIVDSPWDADADAIVVVGRPETAQAAQLRDGALLLGLLSPLEEPAAMQELATTGVTAMAFETLPRTTRAQSMDVLSSQATLAGYQMVLEAASRLPRIFPMMMTAAGTIRPSTVVVLGAGVAGLQAIATARRLGAIVKAFDVRSAAAEQVESLGATFIDVDLEAQDESTSGGYAQQLDADEIARLVAGLQPFLHDADVVVTTAAIPGRRAPVLVTADTVRNMRPGSVIVDGAAATGGNCELTEADKEVVANGVTIVGPTDLPSRVAAHASQMLARNAYELLTHMWSTDELDLEDEIVAGVTITHGGAVVNQRVLALLEETP